MPEIVQLSASVINKIAAGEVIERPASIVKELVENAVDAGATRIDVTLEKGGIDVVRVVDDGCGMTPEQLPRALASHATSKIRDADDLFRVATLGFRGEALAAIAEVTRLLLRSRTEDGPGAELEVVGGKHSEIAPCGCPRGTAVEVRNLFYNTPVRRKFLRTTQTETGHATEAFTRIALAHPRLHFTLRHNGRTIHDLPPTDDVRQRVARLFGEDLADSLIAVDNRGDEGGDSDDGDRVHISGFVADPSQSRANARMQYLFLNGRPIRDRSLQHALGEAYRGLLMTGRYPITFLHIDMSPATIDVNVHPTKMEVRFQDGSRVYSQLLSMLRTRFLTTDLTARARVSQGDSPDGMDASRAEELQRELVDWAKGELAEARSAIDSAGGSLHAQRDLPLPPQTAAAPLQINRLDRSWLGAGDPREDRPPGGEELREPETDEEADDARRFDRPATDRTMGRTTALQVHNRYLVTESPEGVVVIDQHALHERILYEQLREKVLAGAVETQRLLVPEPVDLSPSETAAVLAQQELLAQLGVVIEPFGGDTVLVVGYPAMLANLNPAEMLREVVERILAGGKPLERRDLLDELLHMISCKAAIKAGDYLTAEEIDALITQRHLAQDAHHCPHGRPTSLVFTREDLDRQFGRV